MLRKVYVVITIDTECDKDLNWEIPQPMRFKNIMIQEELLFSVFKKYGVIPTYLLSPEVVDNVDCVNVFKGLKDIELGTHLHEEFVPPLENYNAVRTKNVQANLSIEIERQKLINLTDRFCNAFGYRPKSFRSGRFGSSANTTALLEELGYQVDSSITPFKTHYISEDLIINNWGNSIEPYFTSRSKKLLEVPLSLINSDYEKLPMFLQKKISSHTTFLKKVLVKFGYKTRTRWLRPYRESAEGMIEISDYIINNRFMNKDFAVLNIMFHSNEILEGGSPYCKTKEEVRDFIGSLDKLLNHINKNYNLCSIGLGDLYTIYSQG